MRKLLLLVLLLLPHGVWGQVDETVIATEGEMAALNDTLTAEMPLETQVGEANYHGTTIPHVIFPTLPKYPPLQFQSEKEREKYNRLVYNVKKTLPYAKLAKLIILETTDYLDTLPTKEARRAHVAQVEADLRKQYTPVLKKMTRSQGRLLIKLIDRECNQTGYAIAKAFVGSFKANLYQSFALLFGNSLAKHYDPEGSDRFTERVVKMVEAGVL